MDLYTHIIIRLPYIINMAPYTEIIKRHHTAALKQKQWATWQHTTGESGKGIFSSQSN